MQKKPKARQPKASLIRCVRSPDGRLLADIHHVLPCPNPLWLGTHPDVIRRAVQYNLANSWFGQETAMGEVFIRQLCQAMHKAIMDSLALANKSRLCVLGLEYVTDALDKGELALIVMARDSSRRETKKLASSGIHRRVTMMEFGNRQELGSLFGRHSQVFIGLRPNALTEKLTAYLRCNTGFCEAFSL